MGTFNKIVILVISFIVACIPAYLVGCIFGLATQEQEIGEIVIIPAAVLFVPFVMKYVKKFWNDI